MVWLFPSSGWFFKLSLDILFKNYVYFPTFLTFVWKMYGYSAFHKSQLFNVWTQCTIYMICASVKIIHRFYDAMINDYRSVMTIHLDRVTLPKAYPMCIQVCSTMPRQLFTYIFINEAGLIFKKNVAQTSL